MIVLFWICLVCCFFVQLITEETTRNWITIALDADNQTLKWSEPGVDPSFTTRRCSLSSSEFLSSSWVCDDHACSFVTVLAE